MTGVDGMSKEIRIAIDGPAAAGKSTIAKIVAEKLGVTYIDTGAMYRAITYKALQQAVSVANGEQLAALLQNTSIELQPSVEGQCVYVDGKDVTDAIRSQEVTTNVSEVAAHQAVRELLIKKQQLLAEDQAVVMDGRDIGTTVLPNAELKIYMTASVEERALRRKADNEQRGILIPLKQLQNEIATRDKADTEREISPLRQAEDAIYLDTTNLTIEEAANNIIALAEKRLS